MEDKKEKVREFIDEARVDEQNRRAFAVTDDSKFPIDKAVVAYGDSYTAADIAQGDPQALKDLERWSNGYIVAFSDAMGSGRYNVYVDMQAALPKDARRIARDAVPSDKATPRFVKDVVDVELPGGVEAPDTGEQGNLFSSKQKNVRDSIDEAKEDIGEDSNSRIQMSVRDEPQQRTDNGRWQAEVVMDISLWNNKKIRETIQKQSGNDIDLNVIGETYEVLLFTENRSSCEAIIDRLKALKRDIVENGVLSYEQHPREGMVLWEPTRGKGYQVS